MANKVPLKQDLLGWQIFFIAVSAVIGGVFAPTAQALKIAGPDGALLAIAVGGIVAISVMECVSEFTQLFPAPNAIVDIIAAFVCKDLAWIIGIAYWYTYISIFANQLVEAAALTNYWGLAAIWQALGLYVLAPLVIIALNLCGVKYFGYVESIGGFLKILLVIGTALVLFAIAGHDGRGSSSSPFNQGFKDNPAFASNPGRAFCYAMPLVAYSYVSVEVVIITAYESRDTKSLKWPSRIIAYVITLLMVVDSIGGLLNISWTDTHLPQIGIETGNGTAAAHGTPPQTTNIAILAIWNAGLKSLAGFINACLVFSLVSVSNTSMYVASRTLYGMTRKIEAKNIAAKVLRSFSTVDHRTGVPAAALIVSALSFIWMPFLEYKKDYAVQSLYQITQMTGSVCCLIVWASLCLAFIRYHHWLHICKGDLVGDYARYNRHNGGYRASTFFSWAQPVPAYIGLVGCFFIVFGFTSAQWWDEPATFAKVATAYGAPIVLFVLWAAFKLYNRRLWVTLDPKFTELASRLHSLEWKKRDELSDLESDPAIQGPAGNESTDRDGSHVPQDGQSLVHE